MNWGRFTFISIRIEINLGLDKFLAKILLTYHFLFEDYKFLVEKKKKKKHQFYFSKPKKHQQTNLY